MHLPKIGGGGVTDHDALNNLSFAAAAHTGFAGLAAANVFTGTNTFQDDVTFEQGAAGELVLAGLGVVTEVNLGGNLSQSDWLFKRDVDGGSSYSEAGVVVKIERSVDNVTAENGGYFACDSAFVIDKYGAVTVDATSPPANHKLFNGKVGGVSKGSIDEDGDFAGRKFLANTSVETNLVTSASHTASLSLYPMDRASDAAAAKDLILRAAAAYSAATTNKVGGAVTVAGGVGDGAGGQTAAHGGDLTLAGGAAASDLASSNGGDVILHGGANGSSGNDGTVKLGDSAGTNAVAVATDGSLSLLGTGRKTRHALITNADLGKGSTAPSEVIVGNYTVWEFGINDDAVLDWDMPTDWAVGTDVEVHIHWQIDEAFVTNSGEVQWQVLWSATPHNETEAIDGPTHSGTLDAGDQNIPATAKQLTSTTVGTISGASLAAEDSIGLTLSRIALDDGNNPSGAEPGILHLEIHYIVDSFGEA